MAELLEIMSKMNPWWGGAEFSTGFVREKYLKKIRRYLSSKEILILTGVRRSGKTTLLFQSIDFLIKGGIDPKQILFVNFDNADLSHLKNPIKDILDIYYQEVSLDEHVYLFFDEVHSIENWEKWAKSIYDEKKARLIVSGSSSYLLDGKLASLISGRYLRVDVFPLSFREYLDFHDVKFSNKLSLVSNKNIILRQLKKYYEKGGFPRTVLEEDEVLREDILKSYYESIIYRDVLSLYNVRQVKFMRDLIYYFVSNFTSFYSYKNLSSFFGVDFSTLKEYIGYLENSKIFFELPFFSYSLKAQSRNNKRT